MFVYQRVRCFFFFNRLCDHTPLGSVIAGEPCLFPVVSPQSTQLQEVGFIRNWLEELEISGYWVRRVNF